MTSPSFWRRDGDDLPSSGMVMATAFLPLTQ
jgi:hypothetical protein